MKIRLICVGRMPTNWLKEGAEIYLHRLKRYTPVELVELKEEQGKLKNPAEVLKREGKRILARIPDRARVFVLDERGKQLTSVALARTMEEAQQNQSLDWCFIIGGPYGLDPQVRKRADQLLSLSQMTMTHQMARVLLLEQLYRSGTIIRNEPYHNA